MWIFSLVDRTHTVVEVCSILQPSKQLWCSVVILCSKLVMLCLSNRAQCTDKIVDSAVVSILLLQFTVADCSVFKQVCYFYRLQDVFVVGASCEYLTALALWSIHSAVSHPRVLLLRYVASSVDVICDRTLWCSSWRIVFRAVIEQWRKTPGDEKLRMLKFRCCLSANRNTCTVLCLYCTSILHTYSLFIPLLPVHDASCFPVVCPDHAYACAHMYICIHTHVHTYICACVQTVAILQLSSVAMSVSCWLSAQCGATENARPQSAGLENDGQHFSKLWAKLRGLEMQDWKMTDHVN